MMKPTRRETTRAILEGKLAKLDRRIKAIAEEAYKVRLSLEALDSLPKNIPLTKEARIEQEKAVAAEIAKAEADAAKTIEANIQAEFPGHEVGVDLGTDVTKQEA